MYISTHDSIAMLICMGVLTIIFVLLFIANAELLKQNRFLKDRMKANRIYCTANHIEKPWRERL